MRSGRKAGRSDTADDLADPHDLSNLHFDFRQVPKAGRESITVTDLYHVAVAALPAGYGHLAGCRRAHRLASIAAQVDACVDRHAPEDRVFAHSERRGHIGLADDRTAQRNCQNRLLDAIDLRAAGIDAIELAFEGARIRLSRFDRNERPASSVRASRAASFNSEVGEYGLDPARAQVDAFLEIGQRRGLLLLGLIERPRDACLPLQQRVHALFDLLLIENLLTHDAVEPGAQFGDTVLVGKL